MYWFVISPKDTASLIPAGTYALAEPTIYSSLKSFLWFDDRRQSYIDSIYVVSKPRSAKQYYRLTGLEKQDEPHRI